MQNTFQRIIYSRNQHLEEPRPEVQGKARRDVIDTWGYMKTFFPQFQSVSRNTTRSDIVQLYNRRKAGLIEEFQKGSF